jgi:tetratricopeptide (TPR) repeat protein
MSQTLLEQGIGAALNGLRDEARALLTQVVEADERNEQAWLWLAGIVTDPEDMRTCLENVLQLNPDTAKAREGLAWVEQRYGARPAVQVAEAAPAPEPQSQAALTAMLAETPRVVRPAEPPPAEPPPPLGAAAEQKPAEVPPTPSAAQVAADEAPTTFPCVYCGAQLALERRDCPKCRNSLMIRRAPREKRSIPLSILGILWLLSGVLQVLGGLASTGLTAYAFTKIQSQFQRAHVPKPSFPPAIFVPLAVGLVLGALTIAIGRGLLKRERWAYIVVLVLTIIGFVGTAAFVVLGAAALPKLVEALNSSAAARDRGARLAVGSLMTSLFISLGVQLLYILLVVLSHRDFFGPMVRFQPELDDGSDMDSYNSGVAYKNRGMWYMAAQEWEVAVKKKPRDPVYLHALGLAYVQLKQLDRARETLDRAILLAPEEAKLQESRAAIDRLGKPGKK